MRIAAGNLKGRKVSSVKALKFAKERDELRPTSSKVREAIFNILRDKIMGAIFIDLYAGTGAVGIEALSRGAEKVFFIETDKRRTELIKKAVEECGCSGKAHVIRQLASEFVRKEIEDGLKADVIFLDPPYRSSDELDDMLFMLSGGELLHGDGIVMAEHFSKKKLPDKMERLMKKKDYKYGDAMLTLFRKV